MALVLCLETATKLCSVALCRDGALLAEREAEEDRHVHGEYLNVFVDEVLKEAGLSPKELEAVAVGIGPGSYTGLRIGLSAAKGFCYALDIPILGIGTLETLVQAVRAQEPDLPPDVLLHPMIDARRMEVFTAAYKPDGSLLEPVAAVVLDGTWPNLQPSTSNLQPPTSNLQHVVIGDGADKAVELWANRTDIRHLPGIKPHARYLAPLAEARLAKGETDDLAYLVPAYGKGANVTQPAKKAQ